MDTPKPKLSIFDAVKSRLRGRNLIITIVAVFLITTIIAGFYHFSASLLKSKKNAFAATCTWAGTNSNLWSDAGNWTACPTGSGAPENGVDLIFPVGASNISTSNDLTGLSINSLTFNGSVGQNYSIIGNGFDLVGGIVTTGGSNGSATIGVNSLTFSGSQTFNLDGFLSFGVPTVDLQTNTITLIGNSFATTDFEIQTSTWQNGTLLHTGNLNSNLDPIGGTLNVSASNGNINFTNAGNIRNLNLVSPAVSSVNAGLTACSLSGSGTVTIQTGADFSDGGCALDSTFTGTITGSGSFTKTNGGNQTFNNATVGANITINVNGLYLNLGGTTTVNGNIVINNGGVLFPTGADVTIANNPIVQTGGNVYLYPNNGAKNVTLNGYTFNTGQTNNFGLDVGGLTNFGSAEVTSSNIDLTNATLDMRFFYNVQVGDSFTILTSSGTGSYSGQFANLPSSGTIQFQGFSPALTATVQATYSASNVVITVTAVQSNACSGGNFTTNSGSFASNPSGNYLNNSNCSWVIAPVNGNSVTLHFGTFNTESTNDVVTVYDGISTSSPVLGTFSGNSIPADVVATSGAMLVKFTSNSSVNNTGFTASWTSTTNPGPTITSLTPNNGPIAGGTAVTVTGTNFMSGEFNNIKSIGATGYDGARGMVVDSSGQYVSGEFSGSITLGSTTLTSSGDQDIYVAKLDNAGNYVWAVKAGGVNADGFHRKQSMALSSTDNSLIIAGYYVGTTTFGSTVLTGGSGANSFIAKLDEATGAFTWAISAGGNTTGVLDGDSFPVQYATGPSVDSNGNIFVTGAVKGTTPTFGSINLTLVSPGADVYIAKINSSGVFQWVKNFGDTSSAAKNDPTAVKVDSAGNVYATTAFLQTMQVGSTTLTSLADSGSNGNIAVIKLDSSGNVVWAKSGGTVGTINGYSDIPYGLGIDSNSDIYVSGYFGGSAATFGSFNLFGSATGASTFTAKLDAAGNWLWVKALVSPDFSTARDLFIDSSDNIWIAGTYTNLLTDGTKTISGNSTNAFFGKYDSTGSLLQLTAIGGTGGQLSVSGVGGNQARSIYVLNGKVYVAGEYFSTIGIGNQTISSAGGQDGFITIWESGVTSLTIDGIQTNATYVSPTQLTLTTPSNTAGSKDVVVTNSNGQAYTLALGYTYNAPVLPQVCPSFAPCALLDSTLTFSPLQASAKKYGASGDVNAGDLTLTLVDAARLGISGSTSTCTFSYKFRSSSTWTVLAADVPYDSINGCTATLLKVDQLLWNADFTITAKSTIGSVEKNYLLYANYDFKAGSIGVTNIGGTGI